MARDRFEHAELIRGYFDDRMADYDAFYEPPSEFWRWFNHTFRKAVYLRRDEVLALADRFDCQDVLDVGCGSGRNTVWWARHGIAALHGVDVSREMIDEARAIAARAGVSEQCTFELADFEEWSSDRMWDLAAACGVFDYVIDAEAFEAGVQSLVQVLALITGSVGIGRVHRHGVFRRQNDFAPFPFHKLAAENLAFTLLVKVGSIDEISAPVQVQVEDPPAGILFSTPFERGSESHRSKAKRRNTKPAIA